MYQISYENLNILFANIGKSVDSSYFDKQYLWKALEICHYTAQVEFQKYENKNKVLNEHFFSQALSVDNLSQIENNKDIDPLLAGYAKDLKERMLKDPIVSSIYIHIQNELIKMSEKGVKLSNSFTTHHFIKALNFSVMGAILILVYYSYKTFSFIGLISLAIFALYWLSGKIIKKLSKRGKENKVLSTIEKNINLNSKNKSLYEKNEKLHNVGKWGELEGLNEELSKEFNKLKNQLIIFSNIYPQKKNIDNIYMENDIIKINEEHVPLLLDNIQLGVYKEETIIKTLQNMNKLVQSHLTNLLWTNERELNATHRYWLNKVANSNDLSFLVNKIEVEKEKMT